MIVYFSGTGNTRRCAERLAAALGEELYKLSAHELRHPRARRLVLNGDACSGQRSARLIVMFPVYCWGMPVQVEDYLREKARVLSEIRVTRTLPVTPALWRDFVWMTPLNQDLTEDEKERLALCPADAVTVDLHAAAVALDGRK